MFGRLVGVYSRLNPRLVPEDSLGLRFSVLASILIAEVTIYAMGYYGAAEAVAVPVLTIAGFGYSWKYRRQRNLLMKFVLSVLAITVAILFARELTTSFFDTRLPLIKLLLWLQVLHSFDVPARRDLKFSLASGLTMIAAGAVLSTGMEYIIGLALFSVAAVVSLLYFQIAETSQNADRLLKTGPVRIIAYGVFVWLAGVMVAVPLLLAMPQSTQAKLQSLPISSLQQIFGEFSPQVNNPVYSGDGNPFDQPPRFDPGSYYGFNPYMDLRSRGNLSDDIVLKVRSDSYDLYRGIVFDRYNGKGWEITSEAAEDVSADEQPIFPDIPGRPVSQVRTKVQSFFVEADLPNIIFASWKPEQLFFPANRIKVDSYGSLRSPFELTEGTVYSVISEQPLYSGKILRSYPRASDPPAAPEYTALPDSGEMLDVARLAQEITRDHPDRYDKALAIEGYLKQNYTYDLGVAPQTREGDAVAYFLFEEKRGYCEHFASSMAVIARSAGIPARVVTGYTGGSYNPFTALWEVKQSDAHAWVEIYFGSAGWVPFDPTPGFDVPASQGESQSPWLAGRIFSYLGDVLGGGPASGVLASAGGAIKSAIGFALGIPLMLLVILASAFAVVAWGGRVASSRFLRERRRRNQVKESLGADYSKESLLKEYLRLALRLQKRGLVRRTDETLRAFARRVSGFLEAEEFAELSAIVELLRYAEDPLPDPARQRAQSLARGLMRRLDSGEKTARKPVTGLS
ncbi:MAG: DUF3488 and transglutaminase-like domain-containing protein [Thermoleophilia bacterium]|nr:DUF3488 and transglutaminase-like domain-containing protein [Thermoleophilia bacterium]